MKKAIKSFDKKDLSKQVCVVLGTRPGIIKMGPIIQELERQNINHFTIHAGQHYSPNMDDIFFKDLQLTKPKYTLKNIYINKTHGSQTAMMLIGIENILLKEKPTVVLVCGDANYNLAGALAARKLGLCLGHVESGLRSNDWRMPEEHNRVMIDHISDILFVPTNVAKQNAIKDNVKGKIYVVGNTIVDAIKNNYKIAKKIDILKKLKIKKRKYILLTLHREENLDNEKNVNRFIKLLQVMSKKFDERIIFPIHPRTQKRLKQLSKYNIIISIDNLIIIDPVGYLKFIKLLSSALFVMTDSGGIQEEASILKVPCLTLRENTERPETIKIGSNKLISFSIKKGIEGYHWAKKVKRNWKTPFGKGNTSTKIVNIVRKYL